MNLRRGTLYNLGGAIAPVVIMLVAVPLYLAALGEARFGVLAIVWLLTGYFGFLDFGLGRAAAFAIARHAGSSDDERARVFWTALAVNLLFGLIGAAAMLLLAPLLFGQVFATPDPLMRELEGVLPWLALAVPLLTFEGVLTGALTGRERFLALNLRAAIGSALTQLPPLVLVWTIAPTLEVAVPATVIARALSVALLAALAFRAVPAGWRPRLGGREVQRELLSYGGWISLGAAASQLVTNFDRFLIAAVIGPVPLAFYTVPYQLVTRGALFSRALSGALFPRLTREAPEQRLALAGRAIRGNAALMTFPCVLGIIIMEPFLNLWVGSAFAQSAAPVGQVLALSLWLNAVALIPASLIEASGRPRETTLIALAQGLPFVLLAWLGLSLAGIVGVALARNARSAMDLGLLVWRAGMGAAAARLVIVPVSLLAAALLLVSAEWLAGPLEACTSAVLLGGALWWGLAVSPEARRFASVELPGHIRRLLAGKMT